MLLLSNIDGHMFLFEKYDVKIAGKRSQWLKYMSLIRGIWNRTLEFLLIIERKRNHNKHKRERDKERI